MIPEIKKRKPLDNFKFAVGTGMNWVDINKGILYHIQEYADALNDPKIPKDKKPTKIRMTKLGDNTEIGLADPDTIARKMRDPDPDPRY